MNRFLCASIAVVIFAGPATAQDKQIIFDKNGLIAGWIESSPTSDKSRIYDRDHNFVGTIEPQAPWSDKSVIRNSDGVTQQTIEPEQGSVETTPDPFAPAEDDGN